MSFSISSKKRHAINNSFAAIMGYSAILKCHLAHDNDCLEIIEQIDQAVREGIMILQGNDTGSSQSLDEASVQIHKIIAEQKTPIPELACETILLVEDNTAFCTLLANYLERFGYNVVKAEDGKRAFALFASDPHKFDAVCLDKNLPYINGLELASEIREIRPRIRLLLFTGDAIEEETGVVEGIQFTKALQKPFSLEKFGSFVREILDTNV